MRNPFANDENGKTYELYARLNPSDRFGLMCRYQTRQEALKSCKQWAFQNPDYECKLLEVVQLWRCDAKEECK